MSSRIGTMQAPRSGQFLVPTLVALLAVATFAAVAVSIDRDQGREPAVVSTVQGTAANTPSEMRGGLPVTAFSGTLANTPTEMRAGFAQAAPTDDVVPSTTGRRGVTPRVAPPDGSPVDEPNFHAGQLR